MRHASPANTAPQRGYRVPAPTRADVLSATLRFAYGDQVPNSHAFDALLQDLDAVEVHPH